MGDKKGKINVFKPLNDLLSGDFFGKKFVQNNLPFVMYLTVLLIIYIGYGYYADGVMKKAASLENMEELNSELHSSIRELNEVSLQSHIIELTEDMGLKELKEAPIKIEEKKD